MLRLVAIRICAFWNITKSWRVRLWKGFGEISEKNQINYEIRLKGKNKIIAIAQLLLDGQRMNLNQNQQSDDS